MRGCRRVLCAVLEQHCPVADVPGQIVCNACHKVLHHDPHGGWYCLSSQQTAALVKLVLVYLSIAVLYGAVVEFLERVLQ